MTYKCEPGKYTVKFKTNRFLEDKQVIDTIDFRLPQSSTKTQSNSVSVWHTQRQEAETEPSRLIQMDKERDARAIRRERCDRLKRDTDTKRVNGMINKEMKLWKKVQKDTTIKQNKKTYLYGFEVWKKQNRSAKEGYGRVCSFGCGLEMNIIPTFTLALS
jgi:hypothetical protein